MLARAIKNGGVPGGVSTRFGGSEDVPASDPRTSITETVRVTRTPGGLAFVVEEPGSQTSEAGEAGASEPKRSIHWKWIVVGAVGLFGLILGGIWLVMRLTNRGGA